MLESFLPLLKREIKNIYVSLVPPASKKILPRHIQPWFKIVMTLDGKYSPGYYDGEMKQIQLKTEDVLLVHPGGFLSSGSTGYIQGNCQIIFREKFIRYILSQGRMTCWWHSARPVTPAGKYLIQSLTALPNEPKYHAVFADIIRSLIRIVYMIMEEDKVEMSGKSYYTYQHALEYILNNFHEDINRETVARHIGVTPSHLSRLFMRFEGDDFKDVLKMMRLERAEPLLRDSSYTIDEIACLCGFKSATHFIRVFRKFYETSPGRYRSKL